MGVVAVPVLGKVYMASRGNGAWLSLSGKADRPLHAKSGFDPSKLNVSVSRSHPSARLDAYLKKFEGLVLKGLGSSLKFCCLAEQLVDFYPRFGPLWEWDTAAAHVVAEESGAVIRDLAGRALTYNKPVMKHEAGFIAAGCPELLDFLFERVD